MATKHYAGPTRMIQKKSRKVEAPFSKSYSSNKMNLPSSQQLNDIYQLAITNELLVDQEPKTSVCDIVGFDYSAKLTAQQILIQSSEDHSEQGQILLDQTKKLLRILEYPLRPQNKQQPKQQEIIRTHRTGYEPPRVTPQNSHIKNFYNRQFTKKQPQMNRICQLLSEQQSITELNRHEYFIKPNEAVSEILYPSQYVGKQDYEGPDCEDEHPERVHEKQRQQMQDINKYNHKRSQTMKNPAIIPETTQPITNHYDDYFVSNAKGRQKVRAPKIQKIVLKKRGRDQVLVQSQENEAIKKQQMLSQLKKQFSSICYNNQFTEEEKRVAEELKQLELQLEEIASNSTPHIQNQPQESFRYVGQFQTLTHEHNPHKNEQAKTYETGQQIRTVRVSLTPIRNKGKQQKHPILSKPQSQQTPESKPKLLSNRIQKTLRC